MMSTIELSGRPESRRIRITADAMEETIAYLVKGTANPREAWKLTAIPKKGNAHPTEPGMFARDFDINRVSSDSCEILVTFATIGYDTSGESPYQKEHDMEFGSQEETIFIDLKGNPLRGMDGNPLEQGISVYRPRGVESIMTWHRFFDRKKERRFVGKVNEDRFMDEEAGRWLLLGIDARKLGNDRWQVRRSFLFNEVTHQHQAPVMKTEQYDTGEKDDEGKPIMATRTVVAKRADGRPIIQYQPIYEEADFGQLGLGL